MLQYLFFDLRHALRSLRLRPGFSLLVVVMLALGIGANAAIFQYLGYFVWPTVQAPEPERVVWVYRATPENSRGAFSHQEWRRLESEVGDAFEALSARKIFAASLRASDRTVHAWGRAVSGGYFDVFARPPLLGRLLTAEDDRPGAERVVVLSYETWTRHFDSDPDVVDSSLVVDGGHAYTVVGVTREGFQGTGLWVSIFTPMATTKQLLLGADDPKQRWLQGMGRLAPGVEELALESRLQTLADEFARESGTEAAADGKPALRIDIQPSTTREAPTDDPYLAGARLMMWVVLALLGLACANVANLFLTRGAERTKELAVLVALGANRGRLALRLLLESAILSLVGAGLGLALSTRLTVLLHGYLQAGLPIGFGEWASGSSLFTQSWRMNLFLAGVTAGAAILFSLAPMLQTFRIDLVSALKSETRGGTAGASGGRLNLRKILAVTQVALSAALLLTAGLLVRTLGAVHEVDLGFDPANVSVAALHVPRGDLETMGDAGSPADVFDTVLRRTTELPGVESAAVVRRLPLSFAFAGLDVRTDGVGADAQTAESEAHSVAEVVITTKAAENIASEGYFETFGIPLLQGRPFAATDVADAEPVGIVNRKLAEQLWPGTSAVGRRLSWGEGEDAESVTVVGVVADHRLATPTEPDVPMLYRPFRQNTHRRLTVVTRSRASILQPMHRMLRSEFPDVSLIELVPFDKQRGVATAAQRMNAELSTGFGLLGLFLAGLGIFSVLAYGVARRRREIGIRMAVGARNGDVRRMIFGETARLLAVGLALGLGAALALGQTLKHLLYGVDTFDPLTFGVVIATLTAMGLVAAWWPARRASAVDPMDALRSE